MSVNKGYSGLVQAAADLVQHQFLPSWVAGDYEAKSMSTAKLADRMGHVSDNLKAIATRVRENADALVAERDALQARVDALMLELCPDEMTEQQKANWACHQRPVQSLRQHGDERDGAKGSNASGPAGVEVELRLTGRQVMDALGFVAPDCFTIVNRDSEVDFARATFAEQMESEVTIGRLAAHRTEEGEERSAGVYAWMTDYPEEGSIVLGCADESEKAAEAEKVS